MIDKLTISVPFNGDELYEIIKLYDILRDMDFELSETQVEVFEKLQDAEVNGGFSNDRTTITRVGCQHSYGTNPYGRI